jgi:protein TonB
MQLAQQHQILATRSSGMTPRRAMIIGGVGLLHIAAIYGLMHGMVAKAIEIIHPPIVVTVDTKTPPKIVTPPPPPTLVRPSQPMVESPPKPEIVIADTPPQQTITLPPPTIPTNPQPPADANASGLTATHTVPPYPALARAASHQGTVLLQLVVSPEGAVATATVVTSSGYPELDQAAVAWVISHWKYKPALQNGLAVASQTQAAVKFDLKLARG